MMNQQYDGERRNKRFHQHIAIRLHQQRNGLGSTHIGLTCKLANQTILKRTEPDRKMPTMTNVMRTVVTSNVFHLYHLVVVEQRQRQHRDEYRQQQPSGKTAFSWNFHRSMGLIRHKIKRNLTNSYKKSRRVKEINTSDLYFHFFNFGFIPN